MKNANNNIEMIGSILSSQNGDVNLSGEEINIKAGESTFTQESGNKSVNAGVSVGNNLTQISAGYSQGENNIIQVTHNNSQILAENGNFTLNSKKDTNIIGGNVIAQDINMDILGDLTVETVQDTYEEIGNGFGINIGGSAGGKSSGSSSNNNKNSGGVSNVGITMNAKDIFKQYTGEKSGIVATNSYNSNLSDNENLDNLLNSSSVNVLGNTTNLTNKADTQFINADFEGDITVPTALFTKEGREEIKDAYKNFGSNLATAATGLTTLTTDTAKAIISPVIGKSADDTNIVSSWKQMRTNSVSGINNANTGNSFNTAEELQASLNKNNSKDSVILYSDNGEVTGDGNMVLGFNDSNKQAYINIENIQNTDSNFYDTYYHEVSHNTTSNETTADYLASSGSFALGLQSFLTGKGGSTSNPSISNYNPNSLFLQGNTVQAGSVLEQNKDYAYFAKRPLEGKLWLGIFSDNPIDDKANTEISHEQLFFEDEKGGNIGFFNDNMTRKDNPNLLHTYRPTDKNTIHYDDTIMREAVNNVKPKPYSLLGIGQCDKYNCQDYSDSLREEYLYVLLVL